MSDGFATVMQWFGLSEKTKPEPAKEDPRRHHDWSTWEPIDDKDIKETRSYHGGMTLQSTSQEFSVGRQIRHCLTCKFLQETNVDERPQANNAGYCYR